MKRGQFNKKFPGHFDFGASLRKKFGESSFYRLIRQFKANAKRRGIEFCLTPDQIRRITKLPCFYCGTKPLQKMQNRDSFGPYIYNGIDRKNSARGYSIRNCVPACKWCNRAKSNLTGRKWHSWLRRITRHQTSL